MNSYNLPDFKPITSEELRRLWAEQPCPEARTLVLEIMRYRRLFADIDGHYKNIHQSWRDSVGGDLVALHRLKQVMYYERNRVL
ncbi:hypothetical protein IB234_15060 [Pseudomonas sp. PDM16]|uniref:hypothetical protein n=1 Tax=Pseudomonas sp. PDM16 TaxID=2769292 RepID=UPI001787234F|nr:hypothetical protein [Pseudomonas sp. PDM16]MBD9415880.1 hypothetical protein [Pseudomonas sp. PDM16]